MDLLFVKERTWLDINYVPHLDPPHQRGRMAFLFSSSTPACRRQDRQGELWGVTGPKCSDSQIRSRIQKV